MPFCSGGGVLGACQSVDRDGAEQKRALIGKSS